MAAEAKTSEIPTADTDANGQASVPTGGHVGQYNNVNNETHPSPQKLDFRENSSVQHTAFSQRPHLFNPTHASVTSGSKHKSGHAATGARPDGLSRWSSRDHRKGRHRRPQDLKLRHKVARLFKPDLTNLAWWVAFLFTVGSVVWCINGFLIFLPFVHEQLAPDKTAIGWTAWLGATIFFFAAWPEVWEALIREDAPQYTWDSASTGKDSPNGDTDREKGYKTGDSSQQIIKESGHASRGTRFLGLNLSRFRELGFIGSFIQAMAATTFWTSGFTGLSQVQNSISSNTPLLNGVFWTPQVIGGSGFMISAIIFMLEAQHRWWKPNVTDIGWHVAFWNLMGGAGFTLCGIFGYSMRHWRLYQSALSTFWGSWAFLIGSALQWWESVNPR